ncbi:MAG: PAS domain-containing protein [Myxococcota bacterium]|nr:PAS domain-containing protein [Myxococcota bacterium]
MAERITGYSRDEVLGRDCRAVFAGEGLCGGRCSFCDGRPDEFETLERRMSFVTREGETRQIAMTLRPILLDESGRSGVIASIRDVTEVSELRWRLRTTRSFHGMVGVSKEMRDVFEPIRQGAASDYPILITGER